MTAVTGPTNDITGKWLSRRWFPNTKHDNREDVNEWRIRIERHENGYVMYGLKSKDGLEGAHFEARFTVDGILATGTYREGASPKGEWFGMTYLGAFQLIISDDFNKMDGLWVAAGYNNGKPKTFTDRWEIIREDA